MEEHECINVKNVCEVCKTPMVGHLTLERHQEIVKKNEAWWHEFRINREAERKLQELHRVAIGCKLDQSDRSVDSERRYVEVIE